MLAQKTRILVVEDEKDIRDLIALRLRREGFEVDEAPDGQDAIGKLNRGAYDLVVLDWMLPELSGLELIRSLSAKGSAPGGKLPPVLMVTARVEAADIVLGLEAGADDYLTKPFEIPVLLARVRALLRRARHGQREAGSTQPLEIGEVRIDPEAHEASCRGRKVPLTPYEYKLLLALCENEGRVLTREKLIDLVQGSDVVVVDRAIDTHVFGLRKKLGDCAGIIETIRGVGYRVRSAAGES